MPTTIGTDHPNELILVDEALDPAGSAVVALGLANQDGSDTFPGRTLTPDQAERLAASLALAAAAARASAGLAPAPVAGEQAHSELATAIRAAVPLTDTGPALVDGQGEQATAATSPSPPAAAQAAPSRPPRPTAKSRPSGKRAASGAEAAARETSPRDQQNAAEDQPRGPVAKQLPIADYDQLSAAAITKRLSGLSASQLSKLLAYEQSHRNRKKICKRIAALQA